MSDDAPLTLEEVGPSLERLFSREDLVAIEVSPRALWCLATAVQLATRHPEFAGQTAEWAVEGAVAAFAKLCSEDPTLRRLAEQGWDPSLDLSWDGKRRVGRPKQ